MMKKETLEQHKDKKVRIYLLNGKLYTGKIIGVADDCLKVRDKFNLLVTIANEAVQQVEALDDEGDDEHGTEQRF